MGFQLGRRQPPDENTPLRPYTCLQEFNLTLGQSSGASVIPWVAGAVTGNIAGLGADALVKQVNEEKYRCAASFLTYIYTYLEVLQNGRPG